MISALRALWQFSQEPPLGWLVPLFLLFVVFYALVRLADRFAPAQWFDVSHEDIDKAVSEDARRIELDAAFRAAHPKFTPAAPQGLRPGFTRDHHVITNHSAKGQR